MNPINGSPIDWTPYHVRKARQEKYRRAVARAFILAITGHPLPRLNVVRTTPHVRLRHWAGLLSRAGIKLRQRVGA